MKRWLCVWALLTVCLNGSGAERTVEVRSPDGKNRFVLLCSSEEIRYEVSVSYTHLTLPTNREG